MADLDLQETYLYKLHLIASKLDIFLGQVLQKHADIGLAQFLFLQAVRQKHPVQQGRIAILLGLTPGRVSRLVEGAKQAGWITTDRYEADNVDRRVQVLGLTKAGEIQIEQGMKALENHAFHIFKDQDNPATLMQHIDTLLANMKGEPAMSDNKPKEIPKARQLFRGDINDAVIRVQKAVGVEINDAWWLDKVGNDGTTEQILDRFDQHYPEFVAEHRKGKS